MKIKSTGSPIGPSSTGTVTPSTVAKAYSDSAPARPVKDTTTIMGIPEEELTPKVREAILTLMEEVDKLRRSLDQINKRLEATEQLADQDPLLPVYNRRAFVRELTRVQATVERYDGEASLVYIDLDSFKEVNDTYGHQAGDYVLEDFAKRLASVVRETDVVGRLGGDEFGIILPYTGRDAAVVMTNRLTQELKENPISWEDNLLNVGMSYGIVTIEPGRGVQDTMALADDEMYQHKQKSKQSNK